MPDADVIVVGAGPAGSATALQLARAGAAVTLVERARFPRRKVCGEYLNAGTVRALDALGVGAAVRAAARPLTGIALMPRAAPPVELRFAGESLALARATLDAQLLDAAKAAGARLILGRVEELIRDGDRVCGVEVRDERGERAQIRGRIIVGADGAGSVVARKLGVVRRSKGPRRFALGGHYRGFKGLDGLIEMFVAPGAYFAINPLDPNVANVMVVVHERAVAAWSRDVDAGMSGAAAELGAGRRSFAGVERTGERVAIGPLAFDVTAASAPGVLLAGDAAGFLDPFTGQGVFLALQSARAAAAATLEALEAPEREAAAFERYAREHAHDLRARKRLARVVATLIDVPLLARRAASRLARLPAAADGLLAALAGIAEPERALAPVALARLLV